MKLTANHVDLDTLDQMLTDAQHAVAADGGLAEKIDLALVQLHRFAVNNIEVDTGRTKLSLFMRNDTVGNMVHGMIGTPVRYSPWVRDASHRQQFMRNVAEREMPHVLEALEQDIVISVDGVFE